MTSLKQHIIASQPRARRPTRQRAARRPMREDAGGVNVTCSPGLDAATVVLPLGITLDDRATRMNYLWKALAEFQHCDVLVVAICADSDSYANIETRPLPNPK